MSTLKSFSEINRVTNEHLSDSSISETRFFNLYKVYQHALTYALNDSTEKLFRHYLDLPFSLQVSRYALKGLKRKPRKLLKRVLIYVDPRLGKTANGETASFFFAKTFDLIAVTDRSLMQKSSKSEGHYDVTVSDQVQAGNLALDALEIELLKEINRLAKEADRIKFPNFTRYLKPALQLFFELFHRYYVLLKEQPVEKLILICHYHNESLIAACKLLNIEVIEYQHGLIAQNDIYYVYPETILPCREKALFPDKIVVFGKFWRDLLLKGHEFKEDQIIIGGETALLPVIAPPEMRQAKENAIFIGTQTWLADSFVSYLNDLQKLLQNNHPEWKLIIKLHPLEKEVHKYEHFDGFSNCELHKSGDLQPLLERSRIQISIYSTTLFDSIGLNVLNFALQNYSASSDYAKEMVDNKVAFPLHVDDDPVEQYHSNLPKINELLNRDLLYKPFQNDLMHPLVNPR